MAKKPKKGNWIVILRSNVKEEVGCSGCTEEEARDDPYGNSDYERVIEHLNWEVESVEKNE